MVFLSADSEQDTNQRLKEKEIFVLNEKSMEKTNNSYNLKIKKLLYVDRRHRRRLKSKQRKPPTVTNTKPVTQQLK